MKKTFVIIDGNSLINRAYYAVPKPMITKAGIYTHGIYGFINMLEKIKKDYSPGYIAVAFDLKAPTFRHKAYDEYKAGRRKMPPELAMQLPILKDILRAMKIQLLEMEGFEADDIIGTVAVRGEEHGLEPLIITGDKDELQLATDMTKVIITKKGMTRFDIYDRQTIIEKYGFTPSEFIDFKGLMGDKSDNIPGIPGVGEKTARKLILKYGCVENLIEHLDELPGGKVKSSIEDNEQQALMSKRLATINVNVPVTFDIENCRLTEPDYAELIGIYKKLEFNSFLKKLDAAKVKAQTVNADAGNEAPAIKERYLINTETELDKFGKALKSERIVFLKTFGNKDHKKTPIIYGISIMANKKFFFIDCSDRRVLNKAVSILDEQKHEFVGHDLKDDYYALMRNGMTQFNTAFDTAVGQYVLDSSRSGYDIKTLAFDYSGINIDNENDYFKDRGQMDLFADPSSDLAAYGEQWCIAAAAVTPHIKSLIASEALEKVYYDIELPLIEVLAAMEAEGVAVNNDVLQTAGSELKEKLGEISSKIYEHAGEEFNINSPIQLGHILFEKLELPAGKKTKRGYSTGADVLEKLYDKHPIVPLILEFRTFSKLNSTYVEGLAPLIGDDGRIRAHFQQTVAATGRLSCTEPNLQNLPVREDFGRRIRKAFVAGDDKHVFTGADYSQIELRVLAAMSEDPVLIDAFNQGKDIHRLTASHVLGVPEKEITPIQRSRAKAVNFGIIYGMGAFRLSQELHITRKEADRYIQDYFKKHSKVKDFMDGQIASCRERGYVTTILGRKRFINEIKASNFTTRQSGERLAMNSPIQGSAADIIKKAMILIYKKLREKHLRSRLVLQIHDELIIQTCRDEQEEVEKLLKENMEKATELKVRLAVDLNSADNWYDLK